MNEILDQPKAAALLGITVEQLKQLRDEGQGPPFRRPRDPRCRENVFYFRNEVEAWAASRVVDPAAKTGAA